MREVAARAGVAISSVSRVLSGHPDVSGAMRERVLAAVAELEYKPDFLARSLRRGHTQSVGFVLADISNPLLADIVLGAESSLRAADYSLLLMNSENESALDVAHIRFFQTRRVDGMLLSLAGEGDPEMLATLAQVDVPFVLVDRELPPEYGASSVHNDHASGLADAVRHLADLGHRRIALIGGSLDTLPGRAREEGLRRVVAERPGILHVTTLAGSFSPDHGAAATARLLDMDEPPTAIVCGGNQLLVGCLRVLARRGVQVGRDLSLVTCDDVPLSELYRPPIASVARDTVGLGRAAAELLLRRMRDGDEPETIVLPTLFTPRPSCAVPPAP
jgi:LacI family transcriptional regulator